MPDDRHDHHFSNQHEPDLADVETMLRDLDLEELELLDPPDSVWAGIEAELARETATHAPATAAGSSSVASLAAHRRRRLGTPAMLMSVAAALLLAVVAAAVFLPRGDQPEVIAAVDLRYDPDDPGFDPLGDGTSALARLVEVDDHFEIEIDRAALPSGLDDEDLELWLIEVDDSGAIVDVSSVSVLADQQPSAYRVPDGLDPFVNTVVDISVEPRDGDEQHSGRSILRGVFDV